jgi:DNA-binding response OmpR family regulator
VRLLVTEVSDPRTSNEGVAPTNVQRPPGKRLVLICSADATLSALVGRNLVRRGFEAQLVQWAPCCDDLPAEIVEAPDLVVADLGCPEPWCWQGVERVRARFGSLPALFLTYGWPTRVRLKACQPGALIRKPFAICDLLQALGEVSAAVP